MLMVKGQAVSRQVIGAGIGPERGGENTSRGQEGRGQVRGDGAGLDQQSRAW